MCDIHKHTHAGDGRGALARFQLVIPDADRERFVHQARREGMTLSAWLMTAARKRLEEQQRSEPFEYPEDLEAFFDGCDELEDRTPEPDWEEHLGIISESRTQRPSSS